MNSVAKTDLTFQNFTFNPVTENGQVWLTSAELAKAIGYKKTDAISQLYSRNADGEVGEMLEVSANKIGRVANKHKLKTDEFGKFFLDKSAHSAKQVEAFRYNDEGIKALRHIIHGQQVA
ncbi:hypothetical protein H8R13_17575 [Morganella morganii]|nr:hypothetical protein [Morganella morganii]MBC4013535.1 hypothetical protein [Morganella morganii]